MPRALSVRRVWSTGLRRTRAHASALFLVALGIGGLLAARPTPLCACDVQVAAGLAQLRSALRDLVRVQEAYRDSVGRFATEDELRALSRALAASAGGSASRRGLEWVSNEQDAVLVGMASSADGLSAEMRSRFVERMGHAMHCTIFVGSDTTYRTAKEQFAEEPLCDPCPPDARYLWLAIVLAACFLAFLVLRARTPSDPVGPGRSRGFGGGRER